jgi:large subunit ribosomal protein L25
MSEVKLIAELRTNFGKGAARATRRNKQIPAVIYGHGQAPKHVSVEAHALTMALKTPNVLISLDIAGDGAELVIPKAVQKDPIKRTVDHVDFLAVKKGEKVTVEVPVHTEGELAAGGNLLEHVLSVVSVEAEATHLPEALTVSVEGLTSGASVLAQNLPLPAGVTLVTDAEAVVLQVVAAQAEEPATEAEAEAEGAEA